MLDERIRQLLTAHVDGELSVREREQVERLLHRSADARLLLQKLEGDAVRLRQLPRQNAPRDFSVAVLQRISVRHPAQGATRAVLYRRVPRWARLGAAAAI